MNKYSNMVWNSKLSVYWNLLARSTWKILHACKLENDYLNKHELKIILLPVQWKLSATVSLLQVNVMPRPPVPTSLQEDSRKIKGPEPQEAIFRACGTEWWAHTDAVDSNAWTWTGIHTHTYTVRQTDLNILTGSLQSFSPSAELLLSTPAFNYKTTNTFSLWLTSNTPVLKVHFSLRFACCCCAGNSLLTFLITTLL